MESGNLSINREISLFFRRQSEEHPAKVANMIKKIDETKHKINRIKLNLLRPKKHSNLKEAEEDYIVSNTLEPIKFFTSFQTILTKIPSKPKLPVVPQTPRKIREFEL
jgi:hypothetical protein